MKNVKIADLKARLSEHLRYVKRGQTITVMDRDTPVAQLVPMRKGSTLKIRHPARPGGFKNLKLPPPLKLDFDIVDLLLEDRAKR